MPALLKSHIDKGNVDGAYAYADFLNARNRIYYAADHIAGEYWDDARDELYLAANLLGSAASYLLESGAWGHGLRDHWNDALLWVNTNWPSNGDGYELTMSDILICMLRADNDELMRFIGIVDAYRVSLWNQPFNAEFYAALARGFEIWG